LWTGTGPARQAMTGLVGISFAVPRAFARGACLFRADESADVTFILRRGQVREFHLDAEGRETVTAVVGPGQLGGLAPLLGHPRHGWLAEAVTGVDAWSLATADLLGRMQEDRTLLGLIAGSLAQRLSLAAGLFRDVHLLPVLERVADMELRLAACVRG